jgi:hypothetical protein
LAKTPFTVDPSWSLEQALEAAWEKYTTGGQQYGVTGRVRCLIQWANVVGVEKATSQLEDALRRGVLADQFSKSTIRKLRKAFQGMPKQAPPRPPLDLQGTVRWMAAQRYENETDFLAKAVPPLARALGWGDHQLFFQMRLPGPTVKYVDAVLAPTRTAPPHVLIEVRTTRYQPKIGLLQHMRLMMEVSGAPLGVYLSPDELVVFDEHGEQGLGIDAAPDDFNKVRDLLQNPGAFTQPEEQPAPGSAGATFDSLLQAVDGATTNDEKKKTLEALASVLLSGMPSWRCKYANLVTKSAEIDIVVEQTGAVPDALSEFGRYALVECKNWRKPVDAKHIRDFIGKMKSARVRLGIVFSMRGVTGEQQGTDALREIEKAYASDQMAVVVISRDDFRACADPNQFLALVDERIDRLRFDI